MHLRLNPSFTISHQCDGTFRGNDGQSWVTTAPEDALQIPEDAGEKEDGSRVIANIKFNKEKERATTRRMRTANIWEMIAYKKDL